MAVFIPRLVAIGFDQALVAKLRRRLPAAWRWDVWADPQAAQEHLQANADVDYQVGIANFEDETAAAAVYNEGFWQNFHGRSPHMLWVLAGTPPPESDIQESDIHENHPHTAAEPHPGTQSSKQPHDGATEAPSDSNASSSTSTGEAAESPDALHAALHMPDEVPPPGAQSWQGEDHPFHWIAADRQLGHHLYHAIRSAVARAALLEQRYRLSERQQSLEAQQGHLQAQLKATEERYVHLVGASTDGLWDWDLQSRKVFYSERFKAMLGYSDEPEKFEATIGAWLDRVHPDDVDGVTDALAAHVEGDSVEFQSEHRVRARNGTYLWLRAQARCLRDDNGRALRVVGSTADITRARAVESRLRHATHHDSLTSLANHRLLRERLQRALTWVRQRPNYLFGVLFLDLDRFKSINDSLGHHRGDLLLASLGKRLKASVRSTDTVARFGGEGFIVLLSGIRQPSDATLVAYRLQQVIAAPFDIDGHEVFTTASLGATCGDSAEADAEDLIRQADIAMSQAKDRGGSCVVTFDESMRAARLNRLNLETNLRRALERGELRVVYQPILTLDDERVAGFEALLRWEQPHQGNISPQQFIPLAEEMGLIVPIGEWVLKQACHQLANWKAAHPWMADVFVSVNVSNRQFAGPGIVDAVSASVSESGLDPRSLRLEITESLLSENVDATRTILERLASMQVNICMDDFGTGYSSLSLLSQFPIHTLKLDQSFTQQLSYDRPTQNITDSIMLMAHKLNLEVIAEGIEEQSQLAALRQRRCQFGQGYLFAQPLDPDDLTPLLSQYDT